MTEMVRKILKHSHGLQDQKIMHPEREWLIALTLALLIFLGTSYASIYTYWKNKNIAGSAEVTAPEDAVVYRESIVKEALSRFDKRNKERSALMAEFPGAPVPPSAEATSTKVASTTPKVTEQTSSTTAKVSSEKVVNLRQ